MRIQQLKGKEVPDEGPPVVSVLQIIWPLSLPPPSLLPLILFALVTTYLVRERILSWDDPLSSVASKAANVPKIGAAPFPKPQDNGIAHPQSPAGSGPGVRYDDSLPLNGAAQKPGHAIQDYVVGQPLSSTSASAISAGIVEQGATRAGNARAFELEDQQNMAVALGRRSPDDEV